MYLAQDSHVLHRIQAFAEGLKWAAFFEQNQFHTLPRILADLSRYIGREELTPDGNGVGWFDVLLSRNKGDENKAFQELIALIIKAVEAHEKTAVTDLEPSDVDHGKP